MVKRIRQGTNESSSAHTSRTHTHDLAPAVPRRTVCVILFFRRTMFTNTQTRTYVWPTFSAATTSTWRVVARLPSSIRKGAEARRCSTPVGTWSKKLPPRHGQMRRVLAELHRCLLWFPPFSVLLTFLFSRSTLFRPLRTIPPQCTVPVLKAEKPLSGHTLKAYEPRTNRKLLCDSLRHRE